MIPLLQQLATPAIWLPEQSESDVLTEVQQMTQRAIATQEMLAGKMSFNDYLELLDSHELDIDGTLEDWSENFEYFYLQD